MQYFTPVDEKTNIYRCALCKEEKSGKQKSNLTCHLQKRHNDIYISEVVKRAGVEAKMEQLLLIQNLTEVIAIDHLPFNFLKKSGFQRLISDKLKRCNEEGGSLNLNDHNFKQVKDHLQSVADKIKKKIMDEVGTKPLSAACDIVSKNGRSVFGIYIQYILHGEVKCRCIGMIELRNRHTGEYLCDIFIARFEQFGWKIGRLVALSTDNGSNMKKMLKYIIIQGHDDIDECVTK